MTTITDLVNQIDRDLLTHFSRPLYDVPAANYNDSTTSIALANTNQVGVGSILDVEFELMYVVAWEASTKTATVIRGFLGTTKAGGTTASLVRINPRFPTKAIMDTIVTELHSWDERLFRIENEALAFGADDTAVEATPTTTPYRVLYARPQPSAGDNTFRYVTVELRRGEPASQFASGYSVQVQYPFGSATTVDVAYACGFDFSAVTATTNLEGDLDVTSGMLEVLHWGSVGRIMVGKEAGRLDATVMARPDLDQNVPAGTSVQTGAQYLRMRDLAYDREAKRLAGQWPIRRGNGW